MFTNLQMSQKETHWNNQSKYNPNREKIMMRKLNFPQGKKEEGRQRGLLGSISMRESWILTGK